MKIRRTIPPAAAAEISGADLLHGLGAIFAPRPYLDKLERETREYFDVKYVYFLSSGKSALYLILQALKTLSSKRQVVIPAYTCFSVPSAIVKAGLKVTLCDINPENFDFDHTLLEKTINEDTLCIIPNHLFGIPSDTDRLIRLCKDRQVFIVEDAAQAMGGRHNGRMLGTIGEVGFFSLGRGKNITCGSGGIVVTNSREIAAAVEGQYASLPCPNFVETITEFCQALLMSLFIHPALYWLPAGLPFLKLGKTVFANDFSVIRLSGMKAGLLYRWQERLERSNRTRATMAAWYDERLRLNPKAQPNLAYLRLPVVISSKAMRDRLYSESCKSGLGVGLMYPTAINAIHGLRSEFKDARFPVAERIAEQLLTIPTHELISESDKTTIRELLDRKLTLAERSTHHQVGDKPLETYNHR